MTRKTRIRVETVLWLLVIVVPVLGIVPWHLKARLDGPVAWEGNVAQWAGVWLMINGVALTAWCVSLFLVRGEGTPVPLDPPVRFVAEGPYRAVRNPMVLGVFLILLGEALLYGAFAVWVYGLSLVSLAVLSVHWVEEPQLRRRFGPLYCAYADEVPRWIPRPSRRRRTEPGGANFPCGGRQKAIQ